MTVILAFLLQFFFLAPLSADIPSATSAPVTEFTVIPRDVFVGDEMEIRYAFQSDLSLLPPDAEFLNLSVPDSEDVTVLDMTLSQENDWYAVTAHCMGWHTGNVGIPEIDVSDFNPALEESYIIHIPNITILSIVDYTGKKELRPARAPLVIPGTTWIIYAIIIACVILFVVIIIILFKFKAFKSHLFAAFSSVLIARNFRLLRRRMKRFLRKYLEVETDVFATELARFIRGYMSVRFKKDFEAVTASEFTAAFADAMNYTGSPEVFGATEIIADTLLRCDYVRFSGDTGEQGVLSGEERSSLCSQFITAVACYDKEATA